MTVINRFPVVGASGLDLFSAGVALWRGKRLILGTMAVTTLAALAYGYMATPSYRVTSVLRPVAQFELDALNRSGVYKLQPEQALQRVGAALESYDTRFAYFQAHPEQFNSFQVPGLSVEQRFELFGRNAFQVRRSSASNGEGSPEALTLDLTYRAGDDGVAIIDGLIEQATLVERERIDRDVITVVANRLKELDTRLEKSRVSYEMLKEVQIASLSERDAVKRAQLLDEMRARRTELKTLRANRIAQLDEALLIARRLGIKRPSTPASIAGSAGVNATNVVVADVTSRDPLYFLGSDALEAERAALLQRRSDDFADTRIPQIAKELQLLDRNREVEALEQRKQADLYLQDIASIKAERFALEQVSLQAKDLKLVSVDQRAVNPLDPVSPSKWLLGIGGLLVGLVVGAGIALARHLLIAGMQARSAGTEPLAPQAVARRRDDLIEVDPR
ncbi:MULTISPECIES: Wzz/FepE/Etk N-terminal domain-containing protein [unclassified Pseudomonas]|uniref:Wzz/FepE/Etk N-terminal domain-containing protein n=1 Tax=unclassified Pseudomonas TaxID=196821 RepID=UPI001E438E91|nr:Wzz/FepE/Etk N-terminal domain-containing protein [Pseudomonas sp. DVZ24]MCE0916193.1 Wzz/FepE/Etk N-terminal domain-containing protein [Pseudomonas sp. NMI760_13]MCP8632468.1 Wzz/FepE/Etk N-terminal domain-containing protein [Pseudomonas sp. DVZ6]MDD7784243.1 Wzz/FepE/Etk N-terminal domain-containing protein [Pseudomonas sp. DVZ24]